MSTSKLPSSTPHRFISKHGNTFKVHVHTPDDRIGKRIWGKYWKRVLSDETLFLRMPHTLEPTHGYDKCGNGDDVMETFRANMTDKLGNKICRKRSVKKYGRREAYSQVKKIILKQHSDLIELMLFMGRISKDDLKTEIK